MKTGTLHTDGGARGNPGPAGIGWVLAIAGQEVIKQGEYIGEATNNQAEYLALLAGLKQAAKEGVDSLECFLDSELVVKQLAGKYRVKNEGLKGLFQEAQELSKKFKKITFKHVRREKNKEADRLVNEAIDKEA
jgi:ribonuclease HI